MIDYIINILKGIFNNEGIRTKPDPPEEEIKVKPKEIKIAKKKVKKATKKKKR